MSDVIEGAGKEPVLATDGRSGMLKAILLSKITEKRVSIRKAATDIGISHTTLNRLLAGGNLDIDTLLKISDWAEIPPAGLLASEIGDDVILLLLAIPGLADILTDAATKVKTGELDLLALADIVSYARYRVQENHGKRREQDEGDRKGTE